MQQELTMETITLEEQKREKVPRISGEEALILLGLAKTRITTKNNSVRFIIVFWHNSYQENATQPVSEYTCSSIKLFPSDEYPIKL